MNPTHNPAHDAPTTAVVAAALVALEPAVDAVARALRDAALYLTRHGWTQHAMFSGTGTLPAACALGAINMATLGGLQPPFDTIADDDWRLYCDTAEVATYYAWEHLNPNNSNPELHLDLDGEPVAVWNDTPGRTADEVIAFLTQTADAYEREQRLFTAHLIEATGGAA